MPRFTYRSATAFELDVVYLMGYPEWGDGLSKDAYLAGCRANSKYRRGTWMVLEDAIGELVASYLQWTFQPNAQFTLFGIGSLATVPQRRKSGFGSALIRCAIDEFTARGGDMIFLYADIDPRFYARHGFMTLAPEMQRHTGSTVMALFLRQTDMDTLRKNPALIPGYF